MFRKLLFVIQRNQYHFKFLFLELCSVTWPVFFVDPGLTTLWKGLVSEHSNKMLSYILSHTLLQ